MADRMTPRVSFVSVLRCAEAIAEACAWHEVSAAHLVGTMAQAWTNDPGIPAGRRGVRALWHAPGPEDRSRPRRCRCARRSADRAQPPELPHAAAPAWAARADPHGPGGEDRNPRGAHRRHLSEARSGDRDRRGESGPGLARR